VSRTDTIAAIGHDMARSALAWLAENRTYGGLPDTWSPQDAEPDSAYKPLGETALAASLALREGVAGPREAEAARTLLDHAWDEFHQGDLLYERQLRHPLMSDPLETYAHFARAGYEHAGLRQLCDHLHRLRAARVAEIVPNRRLAVANAARVAGTGPPADWETLIAATWLGATPEPWAIDWMTAYHVTHTVFHVTDWGARRELPADLEDYLRAWLPVWAEVWREVEQWDLLGELLAVDACLTRPACGRALWQDLAAAQLPDGMLPRDGQPLADDPQELFDDHHHPTVVAAAAGTIALSRALGGAGAP
jgi:hypothetical protein